jgi:O2-independent ubiquinone biosynthesis accessory factor UbiT
MTLAPSPRLPRTVQKVVSRLPRYPASRAFTTLLNLTLRRKFPSDVLEALEGHCFVIEAEDAGVQLMFTIRRQRFVPTHTATEPTLRFRASTWDYITLAAREADPDTLFFNRRLSIEGDTETALLVKNTMDTIDIPRTRALLKMMLRAHSP